MDPPAPNQQVLECTWVDAEGALKSRHLNCSFAPTEASDIAPFQVTNADGSVVELRPAALLPDAFGGSNPTVLCDCYELNGKEQANTLALDASLDASAGVLAACSLSAEPASSPEGNNNSNPNHPPSPVVGCKTKREEARHAPSSYSRSSPSGRGDGGGGGDDDDDDDDLLLGEMDDILLDEQPGKKPKRSGGEAEWLGTPLHAMMPGQAQTQTAQRQRQQQQQQQQQQGGGFFDSHQNSINGLAPAALQPGEPLTKDELKNALSMQPQHQRQFLALQQQQILLLQQQQQLIQLQQKQQKELQQQQQKQLQKVVAGGIIRPTSTVPHGFGDPPGGTAAAVPSDMLDHPVPPHPTTIPSAQQLRQMYVQQRQQALHQQQQHQQHYQHQLLLQQSSQLSGIAAGQENAAAFCPHSQQQQITLDKPAKLAAAAAAADAFGAPRSSTCGMPCCSRKAVGPMGRCIAHGGGRRCSEHGCKKSAAQGTLRCKAHGGGRRCIVDGCPKSAQGSTDRCVAHGGGRQCAQPGCTKVARGATPQCVAHGGGYRCSAEGCNKGARGATGKCKAHGGGRRCDYPGCGKSAQTRGKCVAHGKLALRLNEQAAAAAATAATAAPTVVQAQLVSPTPILATGGI